MNATSRFEQLNQLVEEVIYRCNQNPDISEDEVAKEFRGKVSGTITRVIHRLMQKPFHKGTIPPLSIIRTAILMSNAYLEENVNSVIEMRDPEGFSEFGLSWLRWTVGWSRNI